MNLRVVPPAEQASHAAILAQARVVRMRPLRQFPQLPQIALSYSKSRAISPRTGDVVYLGSERAVEPLAQFAFAKSPLPPNFDRRDFLAFRPQANRARRHAEPLGDGCRSQKRFPVG